MVADREKPELIAIVGPTASGKSDLALRVAKEFNGEIIAADSRTIYKGMDIGTAKPSKKQQSEVKHWGLDIIEPGEPFSAQGFKKYAQKAISDIQKRGKLPILVGGTGLYLDAVLYDFKFRPKAKPETRSRLEAMSVEELQGVIKKNEWPLPRNLQNKRHLIRTIETSGKQGKKQPKPLKNTLIIGIMPPNEVLRRNISKRAARIFGAGVMEETKKVFPKMDENSMRYAGIVYKISSRVLKGEINVPEAIRLFEKADWQYARRQKTWFRRNKFIQWFENGEDAYEHIRGVLNKEVASLSP